MLPIHTTQAVRKLPLEGGEGNTYISNDGLDDDIIASTTKTTEGPPKEKICCRSKPEKSFAKASFYDASKQRKENEQN
ncbi:hypothetical protein J6590_103288 [Homalodisca vitripennis]|nr:hypothetical protein J6590_103288 [Homalodisca vitripennis]